MIRRHSTWDGPDRRISNWDGVDRRQPDWYQDDRRPHEEVIERVVEIPAPEPKQSKFFTPSLMVPIAFTVTTALGGFIFDLYKNVTSLEYKQNTIFEKLSEMKQMDTDIKASIKSVEEARSKTDEHISSIEQTMMEMYRSKKQ